MASKRTTGQIERDRADIAGLYLQGETVANIAVVLNRTRPYGMSRHMVNYDLRQIRKAWRAAAVRDFSDKIAEELARIDHLERTYWEAWEHSLLESASSTQYADADADGRPTPTRVTVHTVPGQGDPRYLQGVLMCIDRRIRLLGLDAPEEHEIMHRFDVDAWQDKRRQRLTEVAVLPDDYQFLPPEGIEE